MDKMMNKTMDKEECCENCKFLRELILWNEGGKNLPNYSDISHCCIVWVYKDYEKLLCGNDLGRVHQINMPQLEMCELFERK